MPPSISTIWTGASGSGLWNDPGNWSDGVPVAEATPGDTLATIDNSVQAGSFTVDIVDNEVAGDVLIDTAAQTGTVASASFLLLGQLDLAAGGDATGTLTLQSGVFEIYGGTLANAALLLSGGDLVIGGSDVFNGVAVQGDFITGNGSTLTVAGGVSSFAADAAGDPGQFSVGSGGVLEVNSTLDLSGLLNDNGDPAAVVLISSGLVVGSGPAGGTIDSTLHIQDSGTLDGVSVDGNISLTTNLTRLVERGSAVIGASTDTVQRTVDLGGGVLEVDGALNLFHTTLRNGTVVLAGGTLTLDAASDDSGVTFAVPFATAWTGGAGDGQWATAGNWTNGVPKPSGPYIADQQDVALLDNSQVSGHYVVTIAGNQSVQDLTISGSSASKEPLVKLTGTLSMEYNQTGGGGAFGNLRLNAGTLELDGGTLNVASVQIAGGHLTFGAGTSTLNSDLIYGGFDVAAGATAVVAPYSFDDVTGTIVVDGTLAVQSGFGLSGRVTLGTGGALLLGGPLNADISGDTSSTTTIDVSSGRMEVATDAALLNTLEIDGRIDVDSGNTLTIGAGAMVTLVPPASDVDIAIAGSGGLAVYGTLSASGTVAFAAGTLTLSGATLLGGGSFVGNTVDVTATSTLDNVSLVAGIVLSNGALLRVLDGVFLGDTTDRHTTTLDLGGGTLDVVGTLTLSDVAIVNGTVTVESGGTITADPFSSLNGMPFATVLTNGSLISGQNVTLTGFNIDLAPPGSLSILTGVGADGSASGTSGLFTIASDAAVFGAGTILVTDANGGSNTEVDGLVLADVAGQTLHLQTANWTNGQFEATGGGTLEVGDTHATTTTLAGGLLIGTYSVGPDSVLQLDGAAAIQELLGVVTLDGTGAVLQTDVGGFITPIGQSLTSIGGPRPGNLYNNYYGSVILRDGAHFTASHALNLFGAITLQGATFSAPGVTALFPNGGFGPVSSSFIDGYGTLDTPVDNTYGEIIATGGTLTLLQPITGGSVIADAYSRLIMKGAPTQFQGLILFQSGTFELDGIADGARVQFDGPGIGFGTVATASTLEVTTPQSATITVDGTLDGNIIHLDNFQAIVGDAGLAIAYTSPTTETVTLTSTTGQRVTLNISGDVAKTGVTYAMDLDGTGTLLTFARDPKDAKPVISPGDNETATADLTYQFTDNVHVSGITGSNPSDMLSIANALDGNADQGALSGMLLGVTGKAGASGSFADLQPGNTTSDLGVSGGMHAGTGTPITVQLDTGTAGLVSGSVTIGFTSTAPTAIGGFTTPLASQTVNLSIGVYALAKAKFPKTTFYIDEKAGGDTQQFALPVDALVDVYNYTEGLRATLLSSTGDFTGQAGIASPTGTTGLIAAGSEDASSIVFNANVTPAALAQDAEGGTFTIGLTSDGATTSKLGTTDLGTVAVDVVVDLPDKAKPQITSPAVFYIHPKTSGTTTLHLTLGNYDYADAAPLEDLTATITATTGFTFTNPTASAVIVDGATDTTSFSFVADNVIADFVDSQDDIQTGSVTFHYQTGSGVYQSDLATKTVPISVLFYQPAKPEYLDTLDSISLVIPTPTTSLYYFIHAVPATLVGATRTLDIIAHNYSADDGSADNLVSTITGVSGDFSHATHSQVSDPTGEVTYQVGGGFFDTTDLTFQAIDDATLIQQLGLQTQTGTFTLHQQSIPTDGTTPTYTLPDVTLNVSVEVVEYALPDIEGVTDPVTSGNNPSSGVHPTRTIDLGTLLSGHVGQHLVSIGNLATGTADSLELPQLFGALDLDPGQFNNTYDYTFGGKFAAGTYSDTVGYAPQSVNSTSSTALTPVDITYVYHIVQPTVAAIGWGDVHLTTFDNVAYNFQGAGEFVLVRSKDPSNPFQVQERMTPFGASANVTVGRELGIQIGTDRITIDANRADAVWVNGHDAGLSASNTVLTLAGGQVSGGSGSYVISTSYGEQMTVTISDEGVNGYLNFTIQLDTAHDAPGSVQGLLGPADNSGHEFQLADGSLAPVDVYGNITTSTLYGVYADAWRLTDGTSLLDYDSGQTTSTFTDRNFPADATSLSQLPTAVAAQALQVVANAGITNSVIAQQAALDFALTGKITLLSSAQNVQQLSSNVSAAVVTQDTPAVLTLGVTALQTSQTEAAGGTTTVTFQAYLSGASAAGTQVSWAVTSPDGTYLNAAAFGGTLPSGTVSIAAGLTSVNFTVTLPTAVLGTLPERALQVTIASTDGSSPVSAATAQTEIINSAAEPGPTATPVFSLLGGAGTSVVSNGTLALGRFVQGQTPNAVSFQVANIATVPADDLTGKLTGSDSADFSLQLATVDSAGNFQPIKAGASNQGVVLLPNASSVGSFTDILTLAPVDRNDSGYTQALANQTIVVTDTVVAASAPVLSSPTSHAFGAVHFGDNATVALQIGNAAQSGAAALDASINSGSGGVVGHGAISLLAAGAVDTSSISVGIDTSSVGIKSGLLQLVYTSDAEAGQTLSAGTATLTESGTVWRLATAALAGGPVVTVVHVGDSIAGWIAVNNTDAADGYSEGLRASISAIGAGIGVSGTTGLIAAGGSEATTLAYTVSTASAGHITGAIAVGLTSDGTGTSGLASTTLTPGSVAVDVTVDNHAVAALQQGSGVAVLTGGGTAYTLDFGSVLIGSGTLSGGFGVLNAAGGLADLLSGTVAVASGSGFSLAGLGAFASLGAGQADAQPSVGLDTSVRGSFSETLTITASGSNASGFSEALAPISLTILGEVACFAAGTRIETSGGMCAVEHLAIGDLVRTHAGVLRPIRWIGSRHLVAPGREHRPVCIRANSFGACLPVVDLLLSPDHAVFAEGVLIPARALVNAGGVTSLAVSEVTYFHVELDTHDVILAEGLPCETYLDSDGYARFDQVPGQWSEIVDPCAAVETQGCRVERVRASLQRRLVVA